MLGVKIATVFVISAAIGVLYRIPRSVLFYGSMAGAASWLTTYLMADAGAGVLTANFCGSFLVGGLAEVLARALRKPATIFIIPGFIPLVPGREAYTTMQFLVEGAHREALSMAVQTLLLAGAIAFGIFSSVTAYRLTINYLFGNGIDHVDKG